MRYLTYEDIIIVYGGYDIDKEQLKEEGYHALSNIMSELQTIATDLTYSLSIQYLVSVFYSASVEIVEESFATYATPIFFTFIWVLLSHRNYKEGRHRIHFY